MKNRHKTFLLNMIGLLVVIAGCQKMKLEDQTITAGKLGAKSSGQTSVSNVTGQDFFQLAILPDVQHYTGSVGGGTPALFTRQITWIKSNFTSQSISYVTQLGDLVEHGGNASEWNIAANEMYRLETPITGYPDGIPYGIAVGNHDQDPLGDPALFSTANYLSRFGANRFRGRAYWGGNYGTNPNNNDSHFDVFTANGKNYIVIYIEYANNLNFQTPDINTLVCNWADSVLDANSARKAIIVSHSLINNNPNVGTNYGRQANYRMYDPSGAGPGAGQGSKIYTLLKNHKNIFMMLSGHVGGDGITASGEGYRQEIFDGHTVKIFMSDYQDRVNGGNALMRLMKINTVTDKISIRTFRPTDNSGNNANTVDETDDDSKFSRPLFLEQTHTRSCDFDHDGKSELTLFTNGTWASQTMAASTYGLAGDIAVPADYNGDGKIQRSVYRPSTNTWYREGQAGVTIGTGVNDIPVPADYDGDGSTDVAVFAPATATWTIFGQAPVVYGLNGDIPIPGDYDGDGKMDRALYRPSTGKWYITTIPDQIYGLVGDIPVPGDYDGDGTTDLAVFRPSTNRWYFTSIPAVTFGQAGDIPAPGDYDADGKVDPAVYRPSTNQLLVYYPYGAAAPVTLTLSGGKVVNLSYAVRNVYFP